MSADGASIALLLMLQPAALRQVSASCNRADGAPVTPRLRALSPTLSHTHSHIKTGEARGELRNYRMCTMYRAEIRSEHHVGARRPPNAVRRQSQANEIQSTLNRLFCILHVRPLNHETGAETDGETEE